MDTWVLSALMEMPQVAILAVFSEFHCSSRRLLLQCFLQPLRSPAVLCYLTPPRHVKR